MSDEQSHLATMPGRLSLHELGYECGLPMKHLVISQHSTLYLLQECFMEEHKSINKQMIALSCTINVILVVDLCLTPMQNKC